jgi:hypothetical protein
MADKSPGGALSEVVIRWECVMLPNAESEREALDLEYLAAIGAVVHARQAYDAVLAEHGVESGQAAEADGVVEREIAKRNDVRVRYDAAARV